MLYHCHKNKINKKLKLEDREWYRRTYETFTNYRMLRIISFVIQCSVHWKSVDLLLEDPASDVMQITLARDLFVQAMNNLVAGFGEIEKIFRKIIIKKHSNNNNDPDSYSLFKFNISTQRHYALR